MYFWYAIGNDSFRVSHVMDNKTSKTRKMKNESHISTAIGKGFEKYIKLKIR